MNRRNSVNPHPMATKHRGSAESDYLWTIAFTFIIGAMLGAVITLGAFTTGVIAI